MAEGAFRIGVDNGYVILIIELIDGGAQRFELTAEQAADLAKALFMKAKDLDSKKQVM